MENLKSMNNKEEENTSKMLWESWIIDSEDKNEQEVFNVDDDERQTCDS